MIEVNQSTEKGRSLNKSEPEDESAPQLAIENTQSAIENTENPSHAGVRYDPSLQHTLTNIKTALNFFKKKKNLIVTSSE